MIGLLSIIVAFLATFVNSQNISPSNCGIRPLSSGKIVNGAKAIEGDWAWSVSITNNLRHFCGGVLISDRWVLTAAHCFSTSSSNPSSTLAIDIGVHNRNSKESWVVTRKLSKIIVHESFNPNYLFNDIALIQLQSPVNFDNLYIIPACLPEPNPSLSFNVQSQVAWLTGWGYEKYGGSLSVEKMQVSMPILTDSRCLQRYIGGFSSLSQICAGETTVNSGACQGDSGGPFVIQLDDGKWYVVGLISWGFNCGYGTVFTRVSYFINWIKTKIAAN